MWREWFVVYNRGRRKHWIGVTGYESELRARLSAIVSVAKPVGLIEMTYKDDKMPVAAKFIKW